VLSEMARAEMYEGESEEEGSLRLVRDMQARFHLLEPSADEAKRMGTLLEGADKADYDVARRVASGLVLEAMDFIENGI